MPCGLAHPGSAGATGRCSPKPNPGSTVRPHPGSARLHPAQSSVVGITVDLPEAEPSAVGPGRAARSTAEEAARELGVRQRCRVLPIMF